MNKKLEKSKYVKRAHKLKTVTAYLIKNLGEEDDEALINAMGAIYQISKGAIAKSIKILEKKESQKNNERR